MDCNDYLYLEYGDRGRGPDYYDCWGLFHLIYQRELRIKLPGYDSRYAHSQSGKDIEQVIKQEIVRWRPVEVPSLFDLLLFQIEGKTAHVACALNEYDFIHLQPGCNVAIESRNGKRPRQRYWRRAYAGAYRYV